MDLQGAEPFAPWGGGFAGGQRGEFFRNGLGSYPKDQAQRGWGMEDFGTGTIENKHWGYFFRYIIRSMIEIWLFTVEIIFKLFFGKDKL